MPQVLTAGPASFRRRRFLGTTVGAGAAALTLPTVLELQHQARAQGAAKSDTAVIQIWLAGGPSQYETFDPKPLAPAEYRGPFGTISSAIPGVAICDRLPNHARVLDKTAVIRSVRHTTDDHTAGMHWCITGASPKAILPGGDFPPTHPSTGAAVAWLRGAGQPGIPPYVVFGNDERSNPIFEAIFDATYLDSGHNPFRVNRNPDSADFRVENLAPAADITAARLGDRRRLLSGLDAFRGGLDQRGTLESTERFSRMAFELVAGARAQEAFDISREDPKLRDRYGRHRWGQATLLARRLVERGVTFVTVNSFTYSSLNWDAHLKLEEEYGKALPILDTIVPALIEDLCDRGLDRKVLVVVWGDFGRTPRINGNGGRDHWGNAMSVLLAGGGLKMGQVIGSTAPHGDVPQDRPLWPQDVAATMYRHLGIDPSRAYTDHAGRPIPLLDRGEMIRELV